jgi:hypothetical protein
MLGKDPEDNLAAVVTRDAECIAVERISSVSISASVADA